MNEIIGISIILTGILGPCFIIAYEAYIDWKENDRAEGKKV